MEVLAAEEPTVRDEQPVSPPPAPSPTRRPTRRILLLALAAVALVAAGVWGWQKWSYASVHVSTDDAQVAGHVVPVLAKVGGYVQRVEADDNATVTKGDELVVIDGTDLRDNLAQAEANLAAAQTMAQGGSQAGVTEAQRNASSLQAQIAAARTNAEKARRDFARVQALAAEQIVPAMQLDAAEAAVSAAEANVQSLQQRAGAAQAGVSGAQSSVKMAQAHLAAAEAVRDDAEQQLAYTHVTAPSGGTISRRQVEVGQLVQPGQPLMAIVADADVWVQANFKETDLTHLRAGQPVEIEVDAYPDCTAHGEVESLSAATGATFALLPPDNATGNFTKVVQRVPVRIRVTEGCGAERPLRPGLSTVVHVQTQP